MIENEKLEIYTAEDICEDLENCDDGVQEQIRKVKEELGGKQ